MEQKASKNIQHKICLRQIPVPFSEHFYAKISPCQQKYQKMISIHNKKQNFPSLFKQKPFCNPYRVQRMPGAPLITDHCLKIRSIPLRSKLLIEIIQRIFLLMQKT